MVLSFSSFGVMFLLEKKFQCGTFGHATTISGFKKFAQLSFAASRDHWLFNPASLFLASSTSAMPGSASFQRVRNFHLLTRAQLFPLFELINPFLKFCYGFLLLLGNILLFFYNLLLFLHHFCQHGHHIHRTHPFPIL